MRNKLQIAGYVGLLAVALVAALVAGWSAAGVAVDNQYYDLLVGAGTAAPAESVVVAINERVFRERGGLPAMRAMLADALDELNEAGPGVVAVDVVLADDTDPVMDQRLEAALRATPRLVLPTQLDSEGQWEEPAARFRPLAEAVGHAHFESDRTDGVSRKLALEMVAANDRRWALALEAFRLARGAEAIDSPDDVQVGETLIPAARVNDSRMMYIRYRPAGTIPVISVLEIAQNHELLRGRTVFLGVTALSAAKDRLVNPDHQPVAGVEVHAHAYETLAAGRFLTDASSQTVLLVCVGFVAAAGALFWFLSGWRAYAPGAVLVLLPFLAPAVFLRNDIVFGLLAPLAAAWLSASGAATYQHFVVRRRLRRTESEKERYQQAIHWAAHEMRTPLTAIQGSSELMTRYKMPDEKRGQLTEMINAESKRLARIIQTFLDVERLAEGHMELKREAFAAAELVETTLARVAPLAERKNIRMTLDSEVNGTLLGDRELMEFALYNLLNNAVKYSPADTHVRVNAELNGRHLRLSVADQGIGMDAKELKNIFNKFYRTKSAEQSGETGTGIGLSIVEQIVTHHGGRIEVTSTPGKGSCFTMILGADAAPADAQTVDRRR